MLDSYSSSRTNIENKFNYRVNAVSGTLRKAHPDSIVAFVPLDSELLDLQNPRYEITTRKYDESIRHSWDKTTEYPVTVLQVMLCGDNKAVIEFILKEATCEK